MAKYKVNNAHGLLLPVEMIVDGTAIINCHTLVKSQDVVECPQETDQMKLWIEQGSLFKLT